nr:unnamed protein product [Digitaria exilis]
MCNREAFAIVSVAEDAHLCVEHDALLLPPVLLHELVKHGVVVATVEARWEPSQRRRRGGGAGVHEVVDGEGGSGVPPVVIVEGDGHLEEDGVAVGGDGGGHREVERDTAGGSAILRDTRICRPAQSCATDEVWTKRSRISQLPSPAGAGRGDSIHPGVRGGGGGEAEGFLSSVPGHRVGDGDGFLLPPLWPFPRLEVRSLRLRGS